MSYDFAVWEGATPVDDRAAAREFAERSKASGDAETPAALAKFVQALLAKWPDIDEDEDSPWADAPLAGNLRGSLFYFAAVPSRADEVAGVVAALAKRHELVAFDPQREALVRAPAKNAEPRIKPRDAEARFRAGFVPVLESFGFTLVKKRAQRGVAFEAERAKNELVQRIRVTWLTSSSLGLGISIEHPQAGARIAKALGLDAPAPVLEARLGSCYFARFYVLRDGLAGAEALAKEDGPGFRFDFDVCHASCVARAIGDASHATRTFIVPFFERMSTLRAIERWWNTGWPTKKRSETEKFDPLRDDFRWQAGAGDPAKVGEALSAAVKA